MLALLFAVESLVRTHGNRSKTDVLCTWNDPANSLGIVRVKKVKNMISPATQKENIAVPIKNPRATHDELKPYSRNSKISALRLRQLFTSPRT